MIKDYILGKLKDEVLLNYYYEKVVYILNNPNPNKESYVEKHHILPKSIYPEFKNDPNNLIELSIYNHIMIHYFLAYGVKKRYWQIKMGYALYMICKNNSAKTRFDNIREEDMIQVALIAADAKQNYITCIRELNKDERYRDDKQKKLGRKPFVCLETGETFYSIALCQDKLKINNLSSVLSGKFYSAKGYHFVYLDDKRLSSMSYKEVIEDINNNLEIIINKRKEKAKLTYNSLEYKQKQAIATGSKPFKCLETNEVFNSIAICAKKYNISNGSICSFLKHKNNLHHAKGYHFIYLDEINNRTNEEILREMNSCLRKYFHQKRILCYETGVYYESISEAERKTGITGIGSCVLHKYAFAGGYHWFKEDDDIDKDEYVKNNPIKILNDQIINITNNVIYKSSKDAADILNVSRSMITSVCKSQGKNKCKGNILLYKNDYDKLSQSEIASLTSKISGVILKKELYKKMVSNGEWTSKDGGWNNFQVWYKQNNSRFVGGV